MADPLDVVSMTTPWLENMTSNVRFSGENEFVRSDRLLTILMLLQARGRVPATELAGRLEVSVRTVYRDVEALSTAGVPVYTERGRHGGIELLPGYRTDMTGLTRDEARALFVLTTQSPHADLGLREALRSALAKVMTALPEPFRPYATMTSERVLVDPAGWMRAPDPPRHLAVLQDGVFADRRLRLRYRHSGEPTARGYTVDPYGLVCKGGTWYLVADHRGRPLLLRVSRVEAASVTGTAVRRRPGTDLAAEWERLRQQVEDKPAPVRVVARVRREIVDMFCRVHAQHLAGPPPSGGWPSGGRDGARRDGARRDGARRDGGGRDGGGQDGGGQDGPGGGELGEWAEIELRFRGVAAARPLLAFGADLQVVSPPEVRADLAGIAAAAMASHGADPQAARAS
jgi:predicted DNA-binding transcriptional regulator YafY